MRSPPYLTNLMSALPTYWTLCAFQILLYEDETRRRAYERTAPGVEESHVEIYPCHRKSYKTGPVLARMGISCPMMLCYACACHLPSLSAQSAPIGYICYSHSHPHPIRLCASKPYISRMQIFLLLLNGRLQHRAECCSADRRYACMRYHTCDDHGIIVHAAYL